MGKIVRNSCFSAVGILLLSAVTFSQVPTNPDTVTIQEIQRVTDFTGGNDVSPLLGDTVVVVGVVTGHARSLWAGARWSFIIVDENGGPWSGLQVIQHDTTGDAANTLVTSVSPGDKVRFVGVVEEFATNYGDPRENPSGTQLALLTNPPVPIEYVDFNRPLPPPQVLTCDVFASIETGEQWEEVLVRIENAVIVNNNLPGGQMLIQDATGTMLVDDWSNAVRDSMMAGLYTYPPNGTRINITGFIRHLVTGYAVGPRFTTDIEVLTNPPVISDVTRDPAAPTSADAVQVQAKIVDVNGTVDTAWVFYSVDNGPYSTAIMTGTDSIYTATIPPQPDGAFVKYYLAAVDNDGDRSMVPGDTSLTMFFYRVRDAGLTIRDVQWTPFPSGDSGYEGFVVTVSGVVTTDSTDFPGSYFMQDGTQPWSGIWVRDPGHKPALGTRVQVTGRVVERYGMTVIQDLSDYGVLGQESVPEPVSLRTGDLRTGSPVAESYESMLVQLNNVVVANPFPDAPRNFGEFTVDDGTGEYRVDDMGNHSYSSLDSVLAAGDSIRTLIGIHYYSYGNFKLEPRNDGDFIGVISDVPPKPATTPLTFRLYQNYPNPFNPKTTIRYTLPEASEVRLVIFNLLGQKIRTLVHERQPAGYHLVVWDTRDERGKPVPSGVYLYRIKAGRFTDIKKMILMR